MILYFTGTGNSRYAAECLAHHIGDEAVDVFEYIKSGKARVFASDRPWVFVSPTYAWKLPRIFRDFIKRCGFAGNKRAYFILSCGDDIGAADREIKKLCAKKTLEYCGAYELRMPENYIAMFNVPEREEAGRIMLLAEREIKKAAACILENRAFEEKKTGFVDYLKSAPVNFMFYLTCVKAKAFYATDACIGCGKCADKCMLGNIKIENGRPVWGKNCTHCMACICHCPTEAIEYGKKAIGKWRYQAPEYRKDV